LGIVGAVDQPHEFAGYVAVEPWGTESVLHGQDAWRKNGEIHVADPCGIRGGCQDGEDRRIRVIETDRTYHIVVTQVVLVGVVGAMPGHDVQRRVVDGALPEAPREFRDQAEVALDVFVGGDRSEEVSRIGKTIGSYRSELRQAKRGT